MMEWVETADAGVYYGLGITAVLDDWDILVRRNARRRPIQQPGFYWPEKTRDHRGDLNSNELRLGISADD